MFGKYVHTIALGV